MDLDDCPWFEEPLARKKKFLSEEDLDKILEKMYDKSINTIMKEDAPKIIKKHKEFFKSQIKKKKMKAKSGTAKPSGNGVGKGGAKESPTDGKSLKPSGKKSNYKKGGNTTKKG